MKKTQIYSTQFQIGHRKKCARLRSAHWKQSKHVNEIKMRTRVEKSENSIMHSGVRVCTDFIYVLFSFVSSFFLFLLQYFISTKLYYFHVAFHVIFCLNLYLLLNSHQICLFNVFFYLFSEVLKEKNKILCI